MTKMTRLRVCNIISGAGWGGAERVVSLLLGGIRSRDLDVAVVVFNEGQLADTVRDLGIRVHVCAEGGRTFLSLCHSLRVWLSVNKFDVIHVHGYKELAVVIAASCGHLKTTLVTVHGLQPWTQITLGGALKYWGFMIFARLLGGWFVAVSQEIELRLRSALRTDRVFRISNPVPLQSREETGRDIRSIVGWPSGMKLVGFVGRLELVKGPDLLLTAATLCAPGIGFVFVGDGSMKAALNDVVRSNCLESRVRFLGHVPEAIGYIAGLDLLAVPSRHEGLPMVLLEAALCGVPVVAFDVGGVREVLDGSPCAQLISCGDVQEFARAMDRTVTGKEEIREAIVAWSNSVRAKFSLKAAVESYLALYVMIAADNTIPSGYGSHTDTSSTYR